MSLRKVLTRFGGAMLATMIVAASGTADAAAAPPYTLEERAVAIATPSLLYLETDYTGVVRDKATHQPLHANPITYRRICSAFVVSSAGYAVTSSLCVNPTPNAILRNVLDRLASNLLDEKKITAEARKTYMDQHDKITEFTGSTEGAQPTVTTTAQINIAESGGQPSTRSQIPVEAVLTAKPVADGDVAIVKVARTGLPVAELATDRPATQGMSVVIAAFATTDANYQTFTVQTKQVQVTAVAKSDRSDWYRLSEDVGSTSHGGLVLDTSGKVIGMIDGDNIGQSRTNRGGSAARNIAATLKAAGVDNTLSATDKLYRSGLDAYFNGRYEQAVTELDQVIQQSPDNQMAVAYKQRATDRQAVESDDSGLPAWVIALISAFGGAVIVGAILVVALRRRGRRDEFDADLLVPVSLNPFAPVSGMPTSGSGTGYPPGGFEPTAQAGSVVPTPAPTGIPIPYPPIQLPHGGEDSPERDRTAADAEGAAEKAVAADALPSHTESLATPVAPPPPPPPAEIPEFTWPDDDEVRSEPMDSAHPNPWAPRD